MCVPIIQKKPLGIFYLWILFHVYLDYRHCLLPTWRRRNRSNLQSILRSVDPLCLSCGTNLLKRFKRLLTICFKSETATRCIHVLKSFVYIEETHSVEWKCLGTVEWLLKVKAWRLRKCSNSRGQFGNNIEEEFIRFLV